MNQSLRPRLYRRRKQGASRCDCFGATAQLATRERLPRLRPKGQCRSLPRTLKQWDIRLLITGESWRDQGLATDLRKAAGCRRETFGSAPSVSLSDEFLGLLEVRSHRRQRTTLGSGAGREHPCRMVQVAEATPGHKVRAHKAVLRIVDRGSIVEGAENLPMVIAILQAHPGKPLHWR
jgi:hypothetical protein